ncbi:MAG: hypothetical protein LUD68_09285 [Rikenellaceae bacterium]|nr:hypothetical protein [Rikenellaceae bacterium]
MRTKLITHLLFFLILEFAYLCFSVLYSRSIHLEESYIWNFGLTVVLFLGNSLKVRKTKWMILGGYCFLSLVMMMIGFFARPVEGNPVYLLAITAQFNTPFLPRIGWTSGVKLGIDLIHYFLLFYGALLYWYLVYRAAKKCAVRFE